MAPRPRTRAEIEQFLSGRQVYLRHPDSGYVEPTAWMSEVATFAPRRSARWVQALHPEDREGYFSTYLQALAEPEETVEVEYRIAALEGWTSERVVIVNLLDHEDVRAVVLSVELTGDEPVHIPEGDAGEVGEYDTASWAIFTIGADATTKAVEGNYEALTGRTRDELIGGYGLDLVHPDSANAVLKMMAYLLSHPGSTRHLRDQLVHPDGTLVWAEAMLLNRLQPDGTGDVLMVLVDISPRKHQEEALEASHQEFRLLAEKVGVAVFRTDAGGRITFRNGAFDQLLPGAAEVAAVDDLIHPDVKDEVLAQMIEVALADAAEEWTSEFLAIDGRTVLRARWSATGDVRSADRSYVGSITDVTATVRLRQQAETDALTGLLNRHALEQHIMDAVDRDPHGTLLVFVDLDGFKAVNDGYGHAVGDLVLKRCAQRICEAVRPVDVVGRYGGDEFVIVCRDLPPSQRERADETIRQRLAVALAAPIVWDGGSWPPAASIGTARPEPGESPTRALERADLAMFAVKRARHLKAV